MKYYSRERILLAGTKYNSRGPNITRGDHILLAETKYYSREWNITRGNVLITRGTEKLLAGTKYYSRKWIITRGKKYYSRERIITRGNLFITRGNDILLAGDKYWQYMAPEGFRRPMTVPVLNTIAGFTWYAIYVTRIPIRYGIQPGTPSISSKSPIQRQTSLREHFAYLVSRNNEIHQGWFNLNPCGLNSSNGT